MADFGDESVPEPTACWHTAVRRRDLPVRITIDTQGYCSQAFAAPERPKEQQIVADLVRLHDQ